MTKESVHKLNADALNLFARKGTEGGLNVPQVGQANGVKVRRIMQIRRDVLPRPFDKLRILDLGCGEGCFAIEAGLRGAEVLALDARTQRMDRGAACAERHGLANVQFIQTAESKVEWRGQAYQGRRHREHDDGDTDEVSRSRVLKSIYNTFSFHFTRESLLRAIHDVGSTSVCECHLPFEPDKAEDRITLVSLKGMPVLLSTYPWVNHKSEAGIEGALRDRGEAEPQSGASQ
jgi:SAM-dependent methyltransferase